MDGGGYEEKIGNKVSQPNQWKLCAGFPLDQHIYFVHSFWHEDIFCFSVDMNETLWKTIPLTWSWPFTHSFTCERLCQQVHINLVRSSMEAAIKGAGVSILHSGGSRIFPRGGVNPPGGAWTRQISRKLHEIERIWTPRGGVRPSRPPLDPPMLQIGVGASNLLFLVIFTWKLHEIEKELDRVKFSYFQLIKKSQKKNQFTMAFSVMVATCHLCVENDTNAQLATTTTCASRVRTRELTLSITSFTSSEIVT